MRRPGSVARDLHRWQLALLLIPILAAGHAAFLDAGHDADDAARQKVIAMTETLARITSTAAAIESPNPTEILRPQTESIRMATGVDCGEPAAYRDHHGRARPRRNVLAAGEPTYLT